MDPAELSAERLLRRLEWTVLRRLDGRLQGDVRTLARGAGVDLMDLREYAPGDEIRHVDWNVTARMDTPYVREYAEDRELTAWLLLDRSASMAFGPPQAQKSGVLVELAAALARLLTRGGNRVGALLFDGTVERTVAPAHGRTQVLLLVHELLRPPARDLARPSARTAAGRAARRLRRTPAGDGRRTDLSVMLGAAHGMLRRRSLVVIVSDFISVPGWERDLTLLAQRHDVVAIHLRDPRERVLPDAGEVVIEDPETGEQVVVDTSDPVFRARLAALAQERDDRLARAVRRAGADFFTVSTEDDVLTALVRITLARRRRARR